MTPADLKTARELAATVPMTSVDAEVGAGGNNRFFFSILGLAFVTGLLIVAVATLLASAEAAADQRVLTSVGAGPSIYRSQAAARSGFLTLVGC